MSTTIDKILARVQHLLNKTIGNGATQAEAESAAAMAARLLAEHNLTMAQVEQHTGSAETDYGYAQTDFGQRVPTVASFVTPILDKFFFVKSVFVRFQSRSFDQAGRKRSEKVALRIFGTPDNVQTAQWVYTFLTDTFESLWRQHRLATGAERRVMRGFYAGLQDGLRNRLARERRALETEHTGSHTALAVIDSKLNEAFNATFSNVKSRALGKLSDDSGYADGYAKGQAINLARPIEPQSERKKLN